MAAIREPHLEIEFETPPAVIVEETPDLVTCIVARANQVVEVQNSDGTANVSAVTDVPAALLFLGPWATPLHDADAISLRVDNGPVQTMTFKDAPATGEFLTGTYTQALLVLALNRAFTGVTVVASGTANVLMYSNTSGGSSRLEITAKVGGTPPFPEFNVGYFVVGQTYYTNKKITLNDTFLPDPRTLGTDKQVDTSTVRSFLRRNNVFVEFDPEEAILHGSTFVSIASGTSPDDAQQRTLVAVDDGDSDLFTPKVSVSPIQASLIMDQILYTVLPVATVGGAVDHAIGASGNVVTVEVEDTLVGGVSVTYTPAASTLVIDMGGAAPYPSRTTVAGLVNALPEFSATVVSGGATLVSLLGPINMVGYDPPNWSGLTPEVATIYGDIDCSANLVFATAETLVIELDGGRAVTIEFPAGTVTAASVVVDINAAIPEDPDIAAIAVGGKTIDGVSTDVMTLISSLVSGQFYGRDNSIKLSGSAVTTIFGTDAKFATTHFGKPHKVDYGDEIYVDGTAIGKVVGFEDYQDTTYSDYVVTNGTMILDTEVATSLSTTSWWMKAYGLTALLANNVRPTAAFDLDATNAEYRLKDNMVTDYYGAPVTAQSTVYTGYTALRKDLATDIVQYNDPVSVTEDLEPISIENPFGLMMYIAVSAANGMTVAGISVDEFSATETEGTEDAYYRALEIIEAKSVNRIVSGTLAQEVNELFDAHGTAMALSAISRGRLIFIAEQLDDEAPPDVLGSGNANSAGGADATVTVDQGDVVVEDALLAAGIDPAALSLSDGVFIRVPANAYKYAVVSVTNNILTLQTTAFALGENDDSYYTTAVLPALIDQTISLYVRGNTIDTKDEEITAISNMASHYSYEGTHFVQPSECKITLNGIDYRVDNRYLAASVAGSASRFVPSKNLNGMQLAEVGQVYGSNDRYKPDQLNEAQGAGVFWTQNYRGSVTVRQQLTVTTARSSVIAAKIFLMEFWRAVFEEFFRMQEINDKLQESLATRIEGSSAFLTRKSIVASFEFLRIETDPNDAYGLIGYAECETLKPFEKFTFEIKLI